MFSDPTQITIGASAETFARVSSSSKRMGNGLVDQSVYRTSDGEFTLTISEYFRSTWVRDQARPEYHIRLDRVDLTKDALPVTGVGISFRVTEGYAPNFTDLFSALSGFVTNAVRDRIVSGEN